jgi:AraC-like DNA-binding protein
MMSSRSPGPALRPFVKTLWASDGAGEPRADGADRERVLPTGSMHLVFRLSDHPLRLFQGANDRTGHAVAHDVVGGARATFYVRDISRPVRSVGAQLHPGAAALLLGVPADELAGRHTPLGDIWGRAAAEARERLLEAGSPAQQLDVLESLLAARLPRIRGVHPVVAHALGRFATTSDVRMVVNESGYSHRQFIALFRRAVGLTPKRYCRVLRFQDVLARIAAGPADSWADVVLAAGYSDQPHFNREFRELTGMSPGQYRQIAPASAHHVPIPASRPRGARW